MHRFDVFGRLVGVEREGTRWLVWSLQGEGTRRPPHDFPIPDWADDSSLARYLADLCHEWASPQHGEVRFLE